MLHGLLYNSSDLDIVLSFGAIFFISGTVIFWIAFVPQFAKTLNKLVGINPGFYGPVTTLFTFTAAFLGASVWGNFASINNAIVTERVAIIAYRTTIESVASFKSSGLDKLLHTYVASALNDEWSTLSRGKAAPNTVQIFADLMKESAEFAQRPELNSVAAGMLTRASETLRAARFARVALRFQSVETTRWYAILFLGVLAQLVTMITHLENRKKVPMATVLAIVTGLVFSITVLIALSVNPYEGMIQVNKQPLEAVLVPTTILK